MSRRTEEQDGAVRLGRPAGLPKRWSARRKAEVVVRLLRGGGHRRGRRPPAERAMLRLRPVLRSQRAARACSPVGCSGRRHRTGGAGRHDRLAARLGPALGAGRGPALAEVPAAGEPAAEGMGRAAQAAGGHAAEARPGEPHPARATRDLADRAFVAGAGRGGPGPGGPGRGLARGSRPLPHVTGPPKFHRSGDRNLHTSGRWIRDR